MKAVIFAGGVGTRLWPLSRRKSPKQFEKIVGDKSTLQLAAERLQPDFPWKNIYVATGKPYTPIVTEQLPELPPGHVIGEPQMRDVGPAVALIAAILARDAPQEPIVILWSDHLVKKDKLFRNILLAAEAIVREAPNTIIFVAQKPRFPSENLGWIQYGETVHEKEGFAFHAFVDFQYRPDSETAKRYFQSGQHAWNLGYFVTTPSFLLSLYKDYAPNLYQGITRIAKTWRTSQFQQTLEAIYPTLEKISFDNAILEKLDPSAAFVVAENIEWSDIGAWEALKEALQESRDHTVTLGNVLITDTTDSLVYNYTKQMLVTIDIADMLVVATDDVTLVCPKKSVPKIKKLVESLSGTKNEHLT